MNAAKPNINVTPLIDVLLVLLIIFMVISPVKPTDFKTKIPQKPEQGGKTDDRMLIVALHSDFSISLNNEKHLGTTAEPEKLIARLSQVFRERAENAELARDLTNGEKIEKTVFVKAPRGIEYGSVAKLIDAVKISGAEPISLQIDDLERK